MPRVKITERWLKSLRPDRQTEFYDTLTPSFGIRAGPSGRRVWFVRFRWRGRQQRMKLGIYPDLSIRDARLRAAATLDLVDRGQDPRYGRPHGFKFSQLAERYLEEAKRTKRTWKEDRRRIKRDLLPVWSDLDPDEITRHDVRDVLRSILDRGAPIESNRMRALISRMFNWAMQEDLARANPTQGAPKYGVERAKQRVLRDDEIRSIWTVLEAAGTSTTKDGKTVVHAMPRLFQLLLLTGQRRVEVRTMRWRDIEGDVWTIPEGVVKNRLQHRVFLCPLALAVIDPLHDPETEWVFPGRLGHVPIQSTNKSAKRYREQSGVDFAPHDLRRTFATRLASLGVAPHIVSTVLNHELPGVTFRHYNRYSYDQEKREAMSLWGAHVEQILGLPSPSSTGS